MTQRMAPPITRESVTGVASTNCGMTFWPRFWNEVRSKVISSFFIISPYCTYKGRSKPKSWRNRRKNLRRGIAAGDPRRGIGAGGPEEDQEDDADPEHHEDHLEQAANERVQHRGTQSPPIRSLERGSSASRTPSPNTFKVSTVTAMAMPGASATIGRE